MYSFLTAGSSRQLQFTPTVASSRRRQSGGGLHKCASRIRRQAFLGEASCTFQEAHKGCGAQRLCGPWGQCRHFEISCIPTYKRFWSRSLSQALAMAAHSLRERLARWVLMMRDRSDDDALPITQALLAEMLGVQRPTITKAVHEFERAGLIERGPRQITILDREGLEAASCECYRLMRKRVSSYLPKTYS